MTSSCSLTSLDGLQGGDGGAPSTTPSASSGGGAGLAGPGGGEGAGPGGGGDGGGGATPGERTYLVAIAGNDASGNHASVFVSAISPTDGSLGTWQSTTPLPRQRMQHGAVAVGNRLYVMGGIDGPNLSDVHFAEMSAAGTLGAWVETTPLPTPVTEIGATTFAGRVFVVGGGDGEVRDGVLVGTPNTDGTIPSWVPTTPLPAPRWRLSAFIADGSLVALGGAEATGVQWPTEFFIGPVDAAGSIASYETRSLVEGLRWPCAAYHAGRMYVIGGNNLASSAGDVVRYATFSASAGLGSWATASGPSARVEHGCAAHEGFLYVVAGRSGHAEGPATDHVAYAPILDATGAPGAFVDGPALPGPRRRPQVVLMRIAE